jgi:nudix-type nucleoside diphosphatase (YffH/AdpP family)
MAEILSIATLFEGWAKLLLATIRGPDGRRFERLIEDHGTATCVLPYDRQRKTAILVRQFRAPVCLASGRTETLEAIAGRVETEDPLTAATREALEEAGLRLKALDLVTEAWTMPGVSTERISLFLAPYTLSERIAAGGGHDHEHEHITVVELSLRELANMADAGELDDLKTFALVQSLRLREPSLFA